MNAEYFRVRIQEKFYFYLVKRYDMNKNYLLVLPLVFMFFCAPQSNQNEELGEFAPPDAYLEGSVHPYYGSENPWDRRFFYDQIKFEYKRRGQRQMLDIVEDRPQETIKYCQELLAEDPDDLESLFNLAVAQAHIGDINSAIQTMERAVQAGIPFERFLAGPRDILKPLTDSPEFRKIAARQPIQLLHGPMLGCVTDHIAKFWIRTLNEVPVYVVVSPLEDFSKSKRSEIYLTRSDRDFTTIVEINDLWPSTTYYYDIIVDGKPSLKPNYPTFTTYPRPGDSTRIQIGFGGGGGYYPPNERIWDLIQSYRLSAMLLMGDNVYINMPEMPNGVHYYTYYRRQSRPEFRRMVATTPICAIWDDHDCATDDVWMGPFRDKPEWKMPLFQIFRENWNNPGYGDPEWPACWFSFSIGDVDFFMLDGRFYRTNPFTENPTMLGPVQKEWLLKQLKKSKGTFKVIVSPVPWSLATKGEARDTWNGFKAERQEIFNFLTDNQINGVILLSADRHRSDAWRIDRDDDYPLYEFESSRLTNQHVHELMPAALFGYNEKQSFGLLTFDTTLPDPTVMYQIVSIDNEVIHSLTLKKSEISH
jgi:alkaline phosphatase D